MGPSLRLGATRTYVRNGSTSQVYQGGAGAGNCRVALMGRNSPAPWLQAGRGKPEDGSEVCGPLASQHRPLRSICLTAGHPHPARIPLAQILVKGSSYHRAHLKRRLFAAGIKRPICELCGQGEIWRGEVISMILDHVNGVHDDNRLENLRIVCPNCAATLSTHCGRKNRSLQPERFCLRCGKAFRPRDHRHRYCSRACGTRWNRRGKPRPGARRATRPPREVLLQEIERLGYSAVGRSYGVSDNAIRKWIRAYERERAEAEGLDPDVVEIPRSTWPNRRRNKAA